MWVRGQSAGESRHKGVVTKEQAKEAGKRSRKKKKKLEGNGAAKRSKNEAPEKGCEWVESQRKKNAEL